MNRLEQLHAAGARPARRTIATLLVHIAYGALVGGFASIAG
jgi:hypothetical protein